MELAQIIWIHFATVGLCRWFCLSVRPDGIFEIYGHWLRALYANPKYRKLAYPLGYCEFCFATWISLGVGIWIGIHTKDYSQPFVSIGVNSLILMISQYYFQLPIWSDGVKASESDAPVIDRSQVDVDIYLSNNNGIANGLKDLPYQAATVVPEPASQDPNPYFKVGVDVPVYIKEAESMFQVSDRVCYLDGGFEGVVTKVDMSRPNNLPLYYIDLDDGRQGTALDSGIKKCETESKLRGSLIKT